jgi:hypothetical protein
MKTRVVLEVAPKRAFASALDWPGWSRGAKTADEALGALVSYGRRYATVAKRGGVAFSPPSDASSLEIVERLEGGGGTEFGVPGASATAEAQPVTPAELERLVSLLRGSWAAFDAAARRAVGVELTKGPRGGGRELTKIIGHVREAEAAYLGQLGSRPPSAADEDPEQPMALLRAAFVAALEDAGAGRPFANPRNTKRPWSVPYTIRRSAWHVLDHAWEIEDRSTGG